MAVRMSEVCKSYRLTKKAVEYYIAQGLISPAVQENGYRDFSGDDAERLKKIAVLRGLGLAVADIREVLRDPGGAALRDVSRSWDLEIEDRRRRQELTQKLARDGDWEYAREQLETLERKKSILQKMLDAFPGYYGKYIALHFAPYLNEPITTEEQQQAFETVVRYLDGVELVIPEDLQGYVDEAAKCFDERTMGEMTAELEKAIRDPERYVADNRETLSVYDSVKKTEEYKKTPAYRLRELLQTLCEENGYNDVFIPAMQRLSGTYRAYHAALERADKRFREKRKC